MEIIPFIELKSRNRQYREQLLQSTDEVLTGGVLIGGEVVERFEAEWAEYCGTKYCIGVGNGLDAIRLALLASGIGPGDEVLVPAQTFVATWLAVTQTGATPVPVDVDARSANMSPALARAAISPRTAAIVVVHLHGYLADMGEFQSLARTNGLLLLEDAAQAHGASRAGVKAGAFGHAAAFSFYPTKNLGAIGDAGAVTTNDVNVADRVRLLRSYGAYSNDKYRHVLPGWNSRLDPIQGAALRLFLPHLDSWNLRRRRIAQFYQSELAAHARVADVDLLDSEDHVLHHFVIRSDRRDALRDALRALGIGTEIHYPVAAVDASTEDGAAQPENSDFPEARKHAKEVLSLPMHPWLGHSDAARVVLAVKEVAGAL